MDPGFSNNEVPSKDSGAEPDCRVGKKRGQESSEGVRQIGL